MGAPGVKWTNHMEARLKQLRLEGHTTRGISVILGIGFHSIKRKLELMKAAGEKVPGSNTGHRLPPPRTWADDAEQRRVQQSEAFAELLRECGGSHTSLTIKSQTRGPWA